MWKGKYIMEANLSGSLTIASLFPKIHIIATDISSNMSDFADLEFESTQTLLFQPKYQTYTPDKFKKAMDKHGFIISQGQANTQTGSTIPLQVFSKDNITIFQFLDPKVPGVIPQVWVQVLNNFSLKDAYKQVMDLLSEIGLTESRISRAEVSILVYVPVDSGPMKYLTSLVREDAFSELNDKLKTFAPKVTSIRLGNQFPMGQLNQDGFEITVEPSANNPDNEFYINVHFITRSINNLKTFIDTYQNHLIGDLINILTGGGKNV